MKALIFGGSNGMGKAIAVKICQEGGNVCICSRNADKLKLAEKELASYAGCSVHSQVLDLTDRMSIQNGLSAVLKSFGVPDAVVLNGGGPPPGRFSAISLEQWEKSVFDLFLSNIIILQTLLAQVKDGASFVFILSDVVRSGNPNLVISASLRSGLLGLMKSLAKEYATRQIRFNAISPGPIATERAQQLFKDRADEEGIAVELVKKEFLDTLPMYRMGTPEEIAELAYYLLSGKSGFTSGANIVVDGANNPM